jgi:hypothetical protein
VLNRPALPIMVVLAISFALLIGSAPLLVRELGAQRMLLLAQRDGAVSVATAMGETLAGGPVDIRTTRQLLTLCLDQTLSWRVPLLPGSEAARLLDGCERAAMSALGRAPSLSEAWILLAAVSARQGDWADTLILLTRSRTTFPRDVWSAQARISVLLMVPSEMFDTDQGVAADLDLLVGHWRGRPDLARIYRTRPEIRPLILEAFRRAEALDASRMLNLIDNRSGGS